MSIFCLCKHKLNFVGKILSVTQWIFIGICLCVCVCACVCPHLRKTHENKTAHDPERHRQFTSADSRFRRSVFDSVQNDFLNRISITCLTLLLAKCSNCFSRRDVFYDSLSFYSFISFDWLPCLALCSGRDAALLHRYLHPDNCGFDIYDRTGSLYHHQ